MTETEKMVLKFTGGLGGARYKELFRLLETHGLSPLGKSNTETLLFQYRDSEKVMHDVLAFRLGPPPVVSFPKSYWLGRSNKLSEHLSNFEFSERPTTFGAVSDSQYSAGQIQISRNTYERVLTVCGRVCDDLLSA